MPNDSMGSETCCASVCRHATTLQSRVYASGAIRFAMIGEPQDELDRMKRVGALAALPPGAVNQHIAGLTP